MIRADRALHMTPTHRRALDAAMHLARTSSNIAGLLDRDQAPEEPMLANIEHWLVVAADQAAILRGEIRGLRHEQALRKAMEA